MHHVPSSSGGLSRNLRFRLTIVAIGIAVSAMFVTAQVRICDVGITTCLENLRGDTVKVAANVVGISGEIPVCFPTIVEQGGPPPAVMFVIDQSGSMTGSRGNDPTAARYTIVSAFLDSLYRISPDAEVGVAIFKTTLWLDRTTGVYYSAYFKPLPSVVSVGGVPVPNQSYLQLITLNRTYATSAGAKLGIAIIKDVVATSPVGGGADLTYTPNFSDPCRGDGDCSDFSGETNYNIAFDAARAAFTATTIPKERQFIIFLTDGEPNQPWCIETSTNVNYFQQGINVPTTFSVFFTDNGIAPQSIITMTNAIRASTYSTSNDSSNYWAVTASYGALMDLLINNVLGIMRSQQPVLERGSPLAVTINGLASSSVNDTAALFPSDFPLTSGLNPFDYRIDYRFSNTTTGATRDSTVSDRFYVRRAGSPTAPPGTRYSCTQVTLEVQAAPSPVSAGQVSTLTASILPADLPAGTRSELSQRITWRLDRSFAAPGDTLIGAAGSSAQVSCAQAFRFVHVIASLLDSATLTSTTDTVLVYVNAGADANVWIEKTSSTPLTNENDVLSATFAGATMPQPIDSILLDSATDIMYVYAVVRDRFGNIKRVASNASWGMLPGSDAASVTGSSGKLWEGVVARVGIGEDLLVAREAALTPDTVRVVVTDAPHVDIVNELAENSIQNPTADQDPSRSNCGCGAGVGLAFVPPVFFKARAMRKSRKEKHL